ncbi:MAG: hypothetical protein KatS3mg105_3181 [Gemmatales bacterium]|nr:MAG: hypothetical protein KatS3mg105_3181 [Gemmatales bacterium]
MRRVYSISFTAMASFLVVAGVVLCEEKGREKKNDLAIRSPIAVASEFAGKSQRWPHIAWGKDCYLVVWQEGAAYDGAPDANIMAARLSPDGKALDPKGIVVCKAKHHQIYPKVTFDGENFLVAWQDYRSSRDWDIYAARITPAGKVLDPDGFGVADGPGNQVHPSLASDGKNAFAVWSDLRPRPSGVERYVLAGTSIAKGKPAQHNGTVLSQNGTNGSLLGAIARWDGGSYVIAAQKHPAGWNHGGSWLLRVTPEGKATQVNFDYFGHSYALATDPERRRSFLWSYMQVGHGHYNCVFQSAVLPTKRRHLVVGLPQHYAPVNELWAAAVFDGKNFLVVTERGIDVKGNNTSGVAIEVDLVASRFDPETGQPLDMGHIAFDGTNPGSLLKRVSEVRPKAPTGVVVAEEKRVFERHPALASSGHGRSVLVYSRHAGPGDFTIRCVLLSE